MYHAIGHIRKPAILASCLSLGFLTGGPRSDDGRSGPVLRQRIGHRLRAVDWRAAQSVGVVVGRRPRLAAR